MRELPGERTGPFWVRVGSGGRGIKEVGWEK